MADYYWADRFATESDARLIETARSVHLDHYSEMTDFLAHELATRLEQAHEDS